MKPFTTTTRIEIEIKPAPLGGWYAVRVSDHTQNTLCNTKKTARGALGTARNRWGHGVAVIN